MALAIGQNIKADFRFGVLRLHKSAFDGRPVLPLHGSGNSRSIAGCRKIERKAKNGHEPGMGPHAHSSMIKSVYANLEIWNRVSHYAPYVLEIGTVFIFWQRINSNFAVLRQKRLPARKNGRALQKQLQCTAIL
jgi:hypothetical protein